MGRPNAKSLNSEQMGVIPGGYRKRTPNIMSLAESAAKTAAKRENVFVAPLSFAQKRLWFLSQLYPDSPAYNVPFGISFQGPLERVALKRTLEYLCQRHETLRTSIQKIDGVPSQVIENEINSDLAEYDFSHQSPANANECLEELKDREASESFDLEKGPLIRFRLVQMPEEEHILLITLHHIICDGWSARVLTKELVAAYASFSQGHEPNLPDLSIQYGDYAAWQQDYFTGERLEELLTFWKKELSNLPDVLELPRDRPRPKHQQFDGSTECLQISPEMEARVRSFTQQAKITPAIFFSALFNTLLHRLTGQSDILLGMPVANRDRIELESLVGFIANTIVLRTSLHGNLAFLDVVERVKDSTQRALSHQQLPFEILVEELHPERHLGFNPIFQVMLGVYRDESESTRVGETLIQVLPPYVKSSKFDLTLFVVEGDNLRFQVEYNTHLFDQAYIKHFLGHLEVLLKNVLENPGKPIGTLPILTDVETHQILLEWNSTFEPFPETTLVKLFERQVECTPHSAALKFDAKTLTYRELNHKANQLAHHLKALGVGREVFVGVCMERSLEMVIALLGILKAGGAYVPIDPALPKERMVFMLQDSNVQICLAQSHLKPVEYTGNIFCLDDSSEIEQFPATNPPPINVPEDAAYCIYTSGSTGKPKGAINTHQGICNRLLWGQKQYPIGPDDKVPQKTPFSFDVSVWEFFWPLITGATLVIVKPGLHRDPAALRDLIQSEGVTNIHFVPSLLQAFLNEPGVEHCRSLRRVICSGEALTLELQRRFFEKFQCQLLNFYGPTEASVEVAYWECDPHTPLNFVPIGRPISNAKLHILNSEMTPVPALVAGELHIGGVPVARGYHNRPQLTGERFLPDPFSTKPGARLYKTGDLARYLPDGTIQYLGRIDHQVKIRGFRIELDEIETVLMKHESVRDCVITTAEPSPGNQQLLAYLVLRSGAAREPRFFRDYLKEHLPEYMIPSAFVFLETLPLNPNGKVDRKALPCPAAMHENHARVYTAPRNRIEQLLARIWCDVLRLEKVSIHDNFFEVGGHSLLATQLISRVRSNFQAQIPLSRFFEGPTIAQLGLEIDRSCRNRSNWNSAELKSKPLSDDEVNQFFESQLT